MHSKPEEKKPLGAKARMCASMTPEQLEALSPEERASLGLPPKAEEPEPPSTPEPGLARRGRRT
jgi:hypothetical protein